MTLPFGLTPEQLALLGRSGPPKGSSVEEILRWQWANEARLRDQGLSPRRTQLPDLEVTAPRLPPIPATMPSHGARLPSKPRSRSERPLPYRQTFAQQVQAQEERKIQEGELVGSLMSAAEWHPYIWAAGLGKRLAEGATEGKVGPGLLAETALAAVPFGQKSVKLGKLGKRGVIGAKQVPLPRKINFPAGLEEAAANTPGARATPEGLAIEVERFQKASQAGSESVRGGVFYLPKSTSGWMKSNFRQGRRRGTAENPLWYGGSDRISGEVLIERPLLIKGSVGGTVPFKAIEKFLGKEEAQRMHDAILRVSERHRPSRFDREVFGFGGAPVGVGDLETLIARYGGDPDLAGHILEKSRTGNQLRYAIQENIAANLARKAGYDAILGQGRRRTGKPFITEVFDIRESHYPTQGMEGELRSEFAEEYAKRAGGAGIVPGSSGAAVLSGLAGSIGGGAAGAALDDEHPLRGAALGALAGGAGGVAVGRAAARRGSRVAADRARTAAFDRELLGYRERRAISREGMPAWTDAQRAQAQAERELPYDVITAQDRAKRGERGAVGFIPEGDRPVLPRAEAVKEMKALAQGIRAEMRPYKGGPYTPGGLFSIVRKGEPQAPQAQRPLALKPKKEVATRQTYVLGSPAGSGFVSRTEAALLKGEYKDLELTPQEWMARLSKDPDVSQREVNALFDALYSPNGQGFNSSRKISRRDLLLHLRENSPASRIEREVREWSGGREIDDDAIRDEAESLMEGAREGLQTDAEGYLQAIDLYLAQAEDALRPVFGRKGAELFMQRVRNVGFSSPGFSSADEWLSSLVKEGVSRDEAMATLGKSWGRPLNALLNRRLSIDPGQYRLKGIRPESRVRYEKARKLIADAQKEQRRGLVAFHEMENLEPDDFWDDAQRLLTEDVETGSGNTEYHLQQRHDQELPYRELIHDDPLATRRTTHFNNRSISFATGEVDGKTFNITQLQSDYSPEQLPFDVRPAETRVQLGIASALKLAAEEGMTKLSLPSPGDAREYHGLGKDAAKMIYGKAAPEALQRIMKWLDIPSADFLTRSYGGGWLKISEETRKKILKYGVPILGVAGLTAGHRYLGDTLPESDQKLLGIIKP